MIFQNLQAVGWNYVRTDEITSSISLMMSERDIIHVFYKPSKVLHKVASRNLLTESHLERLLFFALEEEKKNTKKQRWDWLSRSSHTLKRSILDFSIS